MKKENYEFVRYITNDNDARWADPEEIKNAGTIMRINVEDEKCPGCGIPIISDGRITYVDNSDTHTLVFGSTGSKKTRLFGMPLINMFALAGESFIATDPKGELYKKTSGLVNAKGYKTIVLDFRDLTRSDLWNPLKLPYDAYHSGRTDEAISALNDFVHFISEPQRLKTKDIYFVEHGCSMVLAYLLFFIDTAAPEEANILSFAKFFMTYCSPDGVRAISDYVASGSVADVNLRSVLTVANVERTFMCIMSTVTAMLTPFIVRPALCKVLSQSSFDVRDIGNGEKTAIYITVPDEKTTLHFLVASFIKQTYEALIHEAQAQDSTMLPLRLNFLLDEFGNIPTIPDMASMISAARSRNMRFFLMTQGMYQLKRKYEDDAETIKGNCDNWVFLTSREIDLLREVSELCGDSFYTDHGGSVTSRTLISISELQRLKKSDGEALILHGRHYPIVATLPDIDDYMFKTYPPIDKNKHSLPNVEHYSIRAVIDSIRKQERPLPFSQEVFGRARYYVAELEDTPDNDIYVGEIQ